MASYSWVKSATRYQALDEFPNLAAWVERVGKRPAVRRGMEVGAGLRKAVMSEADKQVLFGQRAR
jgi:glutathione S-transferase